MSEEVKNYYMISFIACIIGAPAVLFSQFAGYYAYDYYNGFEISGSIHFDLEVALIASIIIGIVTLGFLYGLYISYLGMQGQASASQVKTGLLSVVVSLAIIVIGALVFVIAMLEDEPEWWFGAGFYFGLIASVVAVFFLYKASQTVAK